MSLRRLLVCGGLLLAACGPTRRLPVPEAEDYVFPVTRPGELRAHDRSQIDEAWQRILVGDIPAAARGFERLLARQPGLVPAQTGLAYARLRGGRTDDAERLFSAVLQQRPQDVSALIGAAAVARKKDDADTALALLQRAVAADSREPTARRRLAEVRLQVTERHVLAGRKAETAGNSERAVAEYRAALDAAPELATLRLDLANLLAKQGQRSEAVAVLEADPTQDRQSLLRLGDLAAELNNFERALEAYRRILSRDPRDPEAMQRSQQVRRAMEMLRMPEEYRRIPGAAQITRADLAAVLATKVLALSRAATAAPSVAVDISGSWAREHIIKILALDLMEVYPNHTFQPGAIARRGDLARAVQRVLDLLKVPPRNAPPIADMTPSNLLYYSASRAVAAGLMDVTPGGAFEAWRPVSGQQAMDVIEALAALVGP